MFVPPFVPNLSVLSFVPNLSVSMARTKAWQVANDLTKAGCKWPETLTCNVFVLFRGDVVQPGTQDGLETTTGAACRTDEEVVMRKMQFQSKNISKSRKHVP